MTIEKVLRPAFGYINVTSSPENGAVVFIDGKKVGQTPYKSERLASGDHTVKVMKEMFFPAENIITVTDSNTIDAPMIMRPNFVSVSITTDSVSYIYVDNEKKGVGYGEDLQFTTHDNNNEGTFSLGGRGVIIAPGNLQYHIGTHEWRFAENTWDYIGESNIYASTSSYSGWIDLYCWGTGNTPTSMMDDSQYYLNFTDWGVNPISNGGNTPNQWRTLSKAEWESILYYRETPSGIRFAMGQVNGVNGVILVPDQWNSDYYPLTHCNEEGVLGDMPNVISASTWNSALKPHGAVFLPCAGKRKNFDNPGTYQESNTWGAYWTPTEAEDVNGLGTEIIKMAYALIPSIYFGIGQGVAIEPYERDYGASVRLVKDVN